MKQKAKRVAISIALVSIFILGGVVVPKVVKGYEVIFTPKPYVAHVSDYERQVNDLWQSGAHQETCKHNAAALVSLELANKYLDITKKEQLQSDYAIPDSLVKSVNATETARKLKK